ncbi:MAG: hypothetical protein ACI9P7_001859 [Candidatus Azotimanducaceae bacterium]
MPIQVRNCLSIFLLGLYCHNLLAQEDGLVEGSASAQGYLIEQDYSDWYQVEVIVFANKNPAASDEVWPLAPLQYPARMVSVNSNPTLFSLEQMQDTEAYLALFSETQIEDPGAASNDDFMFESRNRFKLPKTAETSDAAFDSESGAETEEVDYGQLFVSNAPHPFKPLAKDQRVLNSLARSISRSSLYQRLYHHAWLQPVESEADAFPVLVQAGHHYDEMYQLDGTITISRSRFLHVDTDLWYTEFMPLYQTGDAPLSTSANLLPPELRNRYPEVADWEATRGQNLKVHSHQLKQSRRMRSSTLHFIDHPHFGILIRIEKFEGPVSN